MDASAISSYTHTAPGLLVWDADHALDMPEQFLFCRTFRGFFIQVGKDNLFTRDTGIY